MCHHHQYGHFISAAVALAIVEREKLEREREKIARFSEKLNNRGERERESIKKKKVSLGCSGSDTVLCCDLQCMLKMGKSVLLLLLRFWWCKCWCVCLCTGC